MPSFGSHIHMMLDAMFNKTVHRRRKMMGCGETARRSGATLPGGQVILNAQIVQLDDGFELLRSGNTRHSMWRTVEWRILRELVKDLPRPLLDLGCGDGGFGAMLTDHIDVGIDGDADAVGKCDPAVYGVSYVADLREPLPVGNGSIATAFSNSTLEHVIPLQPAITAVSRALRRGGRLVATVPSSGLTAAMTDAYGPGLARRLNTNMGHHNLWSWAQWGELLRAEGFDQVSFRGYLSRPAVAWFCRRKLFPWPQLASHRSDWLWRHDLPAIRHHVAESLRLRSENETACVLIDAVKK